MGNKYNYENVLGEIACYIAKECNPKIRNYHPIHD